MDTSAKDPFTTLQSIVEQLEFCNYKTEDDLHELKMNAAFIRLKEVANKVSIPLDALVMQNLGGIQIIAKERQEQVEKHGFTIEHDQQHKGGELVGAAMFTLTKISSYYPSWWDERYKVKLLNKTGIEALKVAGAYLAAEIDRLIKEEKRAQISA